jgi:hypothetical protein
MNTFYFLLKTIILLALLYLVGAGVVNIDYSNMQSSDYVLLIIALSTLVAVVNVLDNG